MERSCARCGNVFHEDEKACYRGCTADGAKVNVGHGCGGPSDVPGIKIHINGRVPDSFVEGLKRSLHGDRGR